jgi:hypothetical protein
MRNSMASINNNWRKAKSLADTPKIIILLIIHA